VTSSLADRWQASFTFRIRNQDTLFALRSLLFGLRGRSGTVLLPTFDRHAPWAVDDYGRTISPGFIRRRVLDGTPYADPESIVDTLIAARVTVAAAMQATSLRVQITKGGTPLAGHLFAIGSRVYGIESVAAVGAGIYALGIWPWLRADVAANTAVNFTSPACEMRLTSDGEGADALKALDVLKFATVTLNFDEAAPQ
jgi:hypothetical protein